MNSTTSGNVQCAGRFQFSVPAALTVAGRSQSIYRVKVSTVPRSSASVERILDERLARLLAGRSGSIARTFYLEPGVRAAWYIDNPRTPDLRDLMAVKIVGDHALVVTRGGEVSKSENVEKLVTTVLDAYVARAKAGFCVGYGAITSEPGVNEETLLAFSHPGVPDLEIEFSTRTVREPDTNTYSNLDEEKSVAAAHGGTLTVLRDQPRRAAGLQGTEIWMLAETPEKPVVRFTWHFQGLPQSSSKPMINIMGIAAPGDRAALESIWEQLLGTLEPVPPA